MVWDGTDQEFVYVTTCSPETQFDAVVYVLDMTNHEGYMNC